MASEKYKRRNFTEFFYAEKLSTHIPISSNDDFRLPVFIPILGKPCRKELDRLSKMSLSI